MKTPEYLANFKESLVNTIKDKSVYLKEQVPFYGDWSFARNCSRHSSEQRKACAVFGLGFGAFRVIPTIAAILIGNAYAGLTYNAFIGAFEGLSTFESRN